MPSEAAAFQILAEEAARSRLFARLQYPSDYFAGLELGRRVAEQVLERTPSDGSETVWTGTIPTGPCMWTGTNPGNVTQPNWRPILLSSPNEFRSPPPPSCQSAEVRADTEAVKAFVRTFATNSKAFSYHSPEGSFTDFYTVLSRLLFEDRLDQNPPRSALAYAALASITFDTWIPVVDTFRTLGLITRTLELSELAPINDLTGKR